MNTEAVILKHFMINEKDNTKLQEIKEAVGGVTDSQALRAAIRAYKVKK